MIDHPILFSDGTVKAIPDGDKIQTRRVIKPQPHSLCASIPEVIIGHHLGNAMWRFEDTEGRRAHNEMRCPYGQVGDRLWVRESFLKITSIRIERLHEIGEDDARWVWVITFNRLDS